MRPLRVLAFWKSRTIWLNVLSGAALVGQAVGIPIPDPNPLTVAIVNIVGNLVLRTVTKQPLGLRDED